LDGGGANVGRGQRFTRTPRADLTGTGQWATHFPARATGPNAQACNECHNKPFDDGAGGAAATVHRDPLHSGSLGKFIERNTPHVFAPGAVQRLAEEMTEELHARRDDAIADACRVGSDTDALSAKGVSFGSITARRVSSHPCKVSLDFSGVRGVDNDLVIKPFQWKGSVAFLRDFNRGASHNELGMQAVEIVGDDADGDFDGVKNEFTIGDQTGLAVYLAAQPRPTSSLELDALGLLATPLTSEEKAAINRGAGVFGAVGCASCHVPRLTIDDPIFREPSRNPNYRDAVFPAGQDPVSRGVDPRFPVKFDLTRDQPDNVITDDAGNVVFRLGALRKDSSGRAIAEIYGDLKRHNLGSGIAESIDEVGTGAATFLTENLWGVGSTAPYMHDGRATTLTEAILEHGGAASASRSNFRSLSLSDKRALIAFLENLVLFKIPEE
jgi:cytochrome c peroxidase